MKRGLVLSFFVFAFTQGVMARIGETIPQCAQRYGEAVTNYPGQGSVTAVNQYVKNDITITIWFVKNGYGNALAGMVLYNHASPGEIPGFAMNRLSDDERSGLLATVQGKWEPFKKPNKLAGSPTKVIPVSTSASIMETRRDQVKQTIENALQAQFPKDLLVKLNFYTKDIGFNGSLLLAFEAAHGLAIVSYDAAASIDKWASDVITKREASKPSKKPVLDGF